MVQIPEQVIVHHPRANWILPTMFYVTMAGLAALAVGTVYENSDELAEKIRNFWHIKPYASLGDLIKSFIPGSDSATSAAPIEAPHPAPVVAAPVTPVAPSMAPHPAVEHPTVDMNPNDDPEGFTRADVDGKHFWTKEGGQWVEKTIDKQGNLHYVVDNNNQHITRPCPPDGAKPFDCKAPVVEVPKPVPQPVVHPKPPVSVEHPKPAPVVEKPVPAPAPEPPKPVVVPPPVVPPPAEPECGIENAYKNNTVERHEWVGGDKVHPDGTPMTRQEADLVIDSGEKVGVVTINNVKPEELLQDKNGDGNFTHPDRGSQVGGEWDKGEILPGVTPARIEADIEAFQAAHNGDLPDYLVYDVTDCDGNNVVACYNIHTHHWGFLYPDVGTKTGIPVVTEGRKSVLYTSHDGLLKFLETAKEVKG